MRFPLARSPIAAIVSGLNYGVETADHAADSRTFAAASRVATFEYARPAVTTTTR